MADPVPTMSGANDSAALAATQEETQGGAAAGPAPTEQTESHAPVPSSSSAEKDETAPSADAVANKDTTDTDAKEDGAQPTNAEKATASSEAAGAGAAAGGPAAAAEANAEPSTTQATSHTPQAPQPPPPAVIRSRSDSLSIQPEGTTSAGTDGHLTCNITLLLPTGARHPFRIDERYLAKRNVDVPDVTDAGQKDPFSISVYKLKELILREWRDDWDGKPASPSSIRLIHFGKLLEDKEQLRKYHFSAESPNVVHMSVKPAEMVEEDEAAKSKSGGREGRNREAGSGCCVIL
ncbi:Ubiquitin [Niveomyces insectorum RCEF 264]|uniref:Ubiquitin n=1 Tax=Niveomyces insectorum RCEF 264 TaxID=1081102 RepID=A0A168A6I9_9HYPO|nr:Ubiquitin [Niveomyces insectorum RCEF 264]